MPTLAEMLRQGSWENPNNPYSASLLSDALRGSLSNAESLGRGAAVAPVGIFGDINALAREYVTPKLPSKVQAALESMPAAPTTEAILANIPRGTEARRESSGMEQLGAAMNPMGPVEVAKGAMKGLGAYGRLAAEDIANKLSGLPTRSILGQITPESIYILPPSGKSGFGAFDPRYDPRVKEQERLQSMIRDIELNPTAKNAPTVSLADFEGRPFITSMADRTAAGGKLVGINDVKFNRPVELQGGQDYMFNSPNQVWASAQGPVKQILKNAQEIKQATGQDPLFMPWRMAPTGGDFAAMTGETMLAYADSAMNKTQKNGLNKAIKKLIPDWSGVSDPASVEQFRNASDSTRKAIKQMMDVDFRDRGGLNIGGARLAVSDPAQLAAQEGGVMNVGEIFADKPMIMQSGHPSYPRGVAGQGLGTLAEDRNIFELLPEVSKVRGIFDPTNPSANDLRALQMKPYSGVITSDLLKRLGY